MLKFFFIFIIFRCIFAYPKKYCEICPNHTLCKYELSGPSSTCLGYDENALLTKDNINAILDRINDRRNFIAKGHSNFFPGAANMKKIIWSEELATFAQRWVDQCDQTLRSEKEDQCRNLENLKVGQNIATIIGPSPGFNVKSFVEMWFMQSLNYNGSVTYYNESQDFRSNYFTQLIWANTEKVGCGKAKFYVKHFKTTLVERLVCNFAPRGNIIGKPLYIIGYAATQCADDMQPDKLYSGLCYRPVKANRTYGKLSSVTSLATSLLRIRNLFNDSVKQEIDPVYHNFEQIEKESQNVCSQVNKKSSYGYDNTFDAVKRSHSFENEIFWINNRNNSQQYVENLYQQQKGHSRVYHGHDHKNEFDSIHPETFIKNSRRYNYATTILNYNEGQDYRRNNVNKQCTRNTASNVINYSATECIPCKQKIYKCTRRQKSNVEITPRACEDHKFQTAPREFCGHNRFQTSCDQANRCFQNINCECASITCPTKFCLNMLRTLDYTANTNIEKQNDFRYYDLFPNMASRKQGETLTNIQKEERNGNHETYEISDNQYMKHINKRKEYSPSYSEIKRSVPDDDINFKPFWQIDGYINKKQPELKSIRYTTLANKKTKKAKRIKNTSKTEIKMEHITTKFNPEQKPNSKRVTEKYLSFDELMHLRKFSTGNFSGRRYHDIKPDDGESKHLLRDSDTSETPESTSEYTANTPFIRMKHCTRKLTCTWTAASLTDSAGSVIPGGAGGAAGHMGSRTPPGYVEGCTRTSTCTRDYMNRNKMATLPIETTSSEFDTGDDEDYCERRSLNRRNSNESVSIELDKNVTFYSKLNFENLYINNNDEHTNKSFEDCICDNNNVRNKRNYFNRKTLIKEKQSLVNYRNKRRENIQYQTDENKIVSYGDLYYLVLKKILNLWKSKNSSVCKTNCQCNNVEGILNSNLIIYLSTFVLM